MGFRETDRQPRDAFSNSVSLFREEGKADLPCSFPFSRIQCLAYCKREEKGEMQCRVRSIGSYTTVFPRAHMDPYRQRERERQRQRQLGSYSFPSDAFFITRSVACGSRAPPTSLFQPVCVQAEAQPSQRFDKTHGQCIPQASFRQRLLCIALCRVALPPPRDIALEG